MGEEDKIRKERRNLVKKLCVHTVNGETNKHFNTKLRGTITYVIYIIVGSALLRD